MYILAAVAAGGNLHSYDDVTYSEPIPGRPMHPAYWLFLGTMPRAAK